MSRASDPLAGSPLLDYVLSFQAPPLAAKKRRPSWMPQEEEIRTDWDVFTEGVPPNKFQQRVLHVDDLAVLMSRSEFSAVRLVLIEAKTQDDGFLLLEGEEGQEPELVDPIVIRAAMIAGMAAQGAFNLAPPPLPVVLGGGFSQAAQARLATAGPKTQHMLAFFRFPDPGAAGLRGGNWRLRTILRSLAGKSRAECMELLRDHDRGGAPVEPHLRPYLPKPGQR